MELQIQDLVSSIRKEGIEAANAEAESIIAEAKKKAESIVAGAKSEAQQYKDAAEKEISILRESAAVIAGENVADYAAEVSEVGDVLKKELAEEIKKGLEIRPTKDVQQGFRLAAKDGSGYFDCSDDGIMEMLMPYFRDLDFQ